MYLRLTLVETVFADVGAQIGVTTPEEQPQPTLLKLQRRAFVFITTDADSSNLALEDLRKMDEVQEVYIARGAYDLVAKVSGESLEHLREDVLKRIRNLNGIKSTLTLTVI
jgi:DNA-binding Lrp family transcriptional regulator